MPSRNISPHCGIEALRDGPCDDCDKREQCAVLLNIQLRRDLGKESQSLQAQFPVISSDSW